jgi:hypothetical protein
MRSNLMKIAYVLVKIEALKINILSLISKVSVEDLAKLNGKSSVSFSASDTGIEKLEPVFMRRDSVDNPEWGRSDTNQLLSFINEHLKKNSDADYYIVLTPYRWEPQVKPYVDEFYKNFYMRSPRLVER